MQFLRRSREQPLKLRMTVRRRIRSSDSAGGPGLGTLRMMSDHPQVGRCIAGEVGCLGLRDDDPRRRLFRSKQGSDVESVQSA